MKMKIAYLLDGKDLEKYYKILDHLDNYVDMIWIGRTYRYYGTDIIKTIKGRYPNKKIVFDRKIMARIEIYEEYLVDFLNKGADFITFEPIMEIETYDFAARKSHEYGAGSIVEMRNCFNYIDKLSEIDRAGTDYALVEIQQEQYGGQEQAYDYLAFANIMLKSTKLAVIGDINKSNIEKVMTYKPSLVVLGDNLAQNHEIEEIKEISQLMEKYC